MLKINLLLLCVFFGAMDNNGYSQPNPTVRVVPMSNNQCLVYDRQVSPIGVKACRGNTITYEAIGNNISEVPDKPRKFDAADIDGPREVCPGYAQYYSATPDGPDYFVEWTWDNGVFNPVTYTGNQVIITFGNPVGDISVRQVDRRTGCKSDTCLIEITPFSFDPWPYAGSLIKVCQGQTFELDRMQPHDATVLYEWTVAPTYAATVLDDHLKPNVTVLANYTTICRRLWRWCLSARLADMSATTPPGYT